MAGSPATFKLSMPAGSDSKVGAKNAPLHARWRGDLSVSALSCQGFRLSG
jgi:hypothetical protein